MPILICGCIAITDGAISARAVASENTKRANAKMTCFIINTFEASNTVSNALAANFKCGEYLGENAAG
jgi:hypothetical protein